MIIFVIITSLPSVSIIPLNGGGNGASCVGIKVRTDTTKLSDMETAIFEDDRNSIRDANVQEGGFSGMMFTLGRLVMIK